MSNMKASVRELQHHLAEMLDRVRQGSEVAITKRGKVVARLVPANQAPENLEWPDSAARMKRLSGRSKIKGQPASAIIDELRRERI